MYLLFSHFVRFSFLYSICLLNLLFSLSFFAFARFQIKRNRPLFCATGMIFTRSELIPMYFSAATVCPGRCCSTKLKTLSKVPSPHRRLTTMVLQWCLSLVLLIHYDTLLQIICLYYSALCTASRIVCCNACAGAQEQGQ
jgi:hypothetical protein